MDKLVAIHNKSFDILKNMDIIPWNIDQKDWPVNGGLVTVERIKELDNLLASAKNDGGNKNIIGNTEKNPDGRYKLTGWNLEIPLNHAQTNRKFVSEFN